MIFQSNDPAADTLRILAQSHLGPDPAFRGEIARLFDNPGYKRLYFRRNGLTVDSFGELLWDRGIVGERPNPREVLDYLDELLRRAPRVRGRKRASVTAIDSAETRARKNRLRLFQCSCGQKIRGTRATLVLCGLCYEMRGEIVPFTRIDPLPEEVLAQSYAVGGNS